MTTTTHTFFNDDGEEITVTGARGMSENDARSYAHPDTGRNCLEYHSSEIESAVTALDVMKVRALLTVRPRLASTHINITGEPTLLIRMMSYYQCRFYTAPAPEGSIEIARKMSEIAKLLIDADIDVDAKSQLQAYSVSGEGTLAVEITEIPSRTAMEWAKTT